MDEISQLTEHQTAAVVSRYFVRVRKVILVGDEKQQDPFGLEPNSEFGNTVKTSWMARLGKTGVPISPLLEQHRMHPDIANSISSIFYDSALINALSMQSGIPGVPSTPEYPIWRTFHRQTFPEVGKH